MKRLIFFFLCLLPGAVLAAAFYQVDTYVAHTGESVNVRWSLGPEHDIARYEVQFFHYERGVVAASTTIDVNPLGDVPELSATFSADRGGHYIVKVRACDTSGNCSGWSESTDPDSAFSGDTPRGWWFYFHVAPPSAPSIE